MAEPTDERTATGEQQVCVFTTAHDATSDRVVNREAVSLEEAGYDVTYYTPYEGECPVDVVSYGGVEEGSMLSMTERLRLAVDVAGILARTDYDVYHFHDVEALPVGVFLGAIADTTVIYDVHENVPDTLRDKPIFPESLRPFAAAAAGVAERTLSRFVDGLIAASPDIAERFADRDDLAVVTNYPKRRWAEETDPEAHILPDDDGPVRFVYRGLLSEGRGVLTLIEAIDRIPASYDVELALGGRYASEDVQQRIESRIEDSDRVEFVEWFSTLEDMIDHFRAADVGTVCFHPEQNKTEAVHRSNKLFQYMSAGLPIVVSDVGNWPELVEDAGCGVAVDPEDPDAIASTMTELIDEPGRRETLGRNGHQAALDRYNWETQRAELLSKYERFAADEAHALDRELVEGREIGQPTD